MHILQRASVIVLPLVLLLGGGAAAQTTAPRHHEGLGSLHFPTSAPPAAQAHFERGVLLMHSFEYDDAAAAFRAAQQAAPDFALAYWGEALTHNHPVWNQQDRDAALAVLARYAPTPAARAAKAPTHRERMYMEAADVLYGPGTKAERDTLYAAAMAKLVAAHPDDYEARAFHALALLGLSRGSRDVPVYMKAGAEALRLFRENPDHPGAAHYVIHAFDDPTHAPIGLDAARAYAAIAPDAAHAQHMTTHIFLALGMWDDVVEANERASAVVDRARAADGVGPSSCGHYNEWLSYGYAQQKRNADAEALVLGCLAQAAADARWSMSAEEMRALHIAATEDLAGAVARTSVDAAKAPPAARPTVLMVQHWTAGYIAARQGRADEAARHLEAMRAHLDAKPQLIEYFAPYAPVLLGTLRAAVAQARGDLDAAIAAAHEAAEMEDALPVDFGPPLAAKPARELEAELLLVAGRIEEARSAFRQALARTPGRARTVAGYESAMARGK